jgi:hypothetical protein
MMDVGDEDLHAVAAPLWIEFHLMKADKIYDYKRFLKAFRSTLRNGSQ